MCNAVVDNCHLEERGGPWCSVCVCSKDDLSFLRKRLGYAAVEIQSLRKEVAQLRQTSTKTAHLKEVDEKGFTTSSDRLALVEIMQENYPPRDLRVYRKTSYGGPVPQDELFHLVDMQNTLGKEHRLRLSFLLEMI